MGVISVQDRKQGFARTLTTATTTTTTKKTLLTRSQRDLV